MNNGTTVHGTLDASDPPERTGRRFHTVLVTGGSGFIGTNFIRYMLGQEAGFSGRIVNLDALTYAGNPANLADLAGDASDRYRFVHGDVGDAAILRTIFAHEKPDAVVHFAAESHVDRSIHGPQAFLDTNITGTFTLLETVREFWQDRTDVLFHHVSTDEVFGSLGPTGYFAEETAYDPRSPYSATKAGSDHLVRAYHHTYGLPVTITNCSNNYGPYQFPEKLIPLMILNMLARKPLPVYGDGTNIRDWLYVEDHNSAVWTVMQHSPAGTTYLVGGENEWENIRLVETLCDIVAEEIGVTAGEIRDLITFVTDRPGHDRRYAIDCTRIKRDLGWSQRHTFDQGLRNTVRWYLQNKDWVADVESGTYREWVEKNYGAR